MTKVFLFAVMALSAGQSKMSSDGVPFPPAPENVVDADKAVPLGKSMPTTLKGIEGIMLRPLSSLPAKIYSSDKSGKVLSAKLTRPVIRENVANDVNNNEVTQLHKNATDQLRPPCGWFSLGIAGANVLGLDCPGGYVEKAVLYYPDGQNAQRAVAASYGVAKSTQAGGRTLNVGGWTPLNGATGECLLSVGDDGLTVVWHPKPGNYPVFVVLSPSAEDSRLAMAKHELAVGMDFWEATASQGESHRVYSEQGVEVREFTGYSTIARFEGGKLTRLGR